MTVYVDNISTWPTTIRCFKGGSCHLVADTVEELHGFAAKLGLRRGWFQPSSWPHYDLTPARREKAVALGAIPVTGRWLAQWRVEKRRSTHAIPEDSGGTE